MLHGYNDKLHVLAKDVLEKAKFLQVKPERLEVMKDQVCFAHSQICAVLTPGSS